MLTQHSRRLKSGRTVISAVTNEMTTMGRLLAVALALLVCGPPMLCARPSEYQLDSSVMPCEAARAAPHRPDRQPQCTHDGRFRPVQCSGLGQECWCVDGEGRQVAATRSNGSVPQCASACHLQSSSRCSPSGHFLPVQCDSGGRQCWCVDQDGMELYGTRQSGTPHSCPSSCSALSRRVLHNAVSSSPSSSSSSSWSSPPQCSDDGNFLPVQCQFVNMTDRRELDMLHAFNTFPEAFSTFKSFREAFPLVSAYCFCSDSRGREMADTGCPCCGAGVELLPSDVYDSAFSDVGVAHSFAESTVFKVFQRRMLGVHLTISGQFRCPSACEEERRAAKATLAVYLPSCLEGGAFASKQCQQGGQCWCVDPMGAEVPGTRQHGDFLQCGGVASEDCVSLRRVSLSRLFSGPLESHLPAPSSSGDSASCQVLLRAIEALLPMEPDPLSFLSVMVDVLHGLFPSVGRALEALASAPTHRLQEFLFGGKFLRNAASFNLSGAVGTPGGLRMDPASGPSRHQNLVLAVSRALEDRDFLAGVRLTLMSSSGSASLRQVLTPILHSCAATASPEGAAAAVFVPSCATDGSFQEVQCQGGECWCVTTRGRKIDGTQVRGVRPRCPSRCESERAAALRMRDKMVVGADVHVPACSRDGRFLTLQCRRSGCFCVDQRGVPTAAPSPGAHLACADMSPENHRSSSGQCFRALQAVVTFGREVSKAMTLSNSSHIPTGYASLSAEGLLLTPEALPLSDWLLSRSKAALRLATYSIVSFRACFSFQPPARSVDCILQIVLKSVQMLRAAGRLAYQPFSPQCDNDGEWRPTQCYHSTGQCWCVDEDGDYVPESLSSRSLPLVRCLTRCQRAQSHSLLSGWLKASDITTNASGYRPQCDGDGRFSVLQTEGGAGWCVHPVSGETLRNAILSPDGQLTCPSWCELQGLRCHPDGSFIPLQCDITSCWCVSEDGLEVSGTRQLQVTGGMASCERPDGCPAAAIAHGTLVCGPAQNGRQGCDLVCHRGYHVALPVRRFTCDTLGRRWEGDLRPLPGACQMSMPPQRVWASHNWSLVAACQNPRAIRSQLLRDMTSGGLCSAQLPASGRSVSVCRNSALRVRCLGDTSWSVTVTWNAHMSDLPTSELPTLYDIVTFLNVSRLLERFERLLTQHSNITSRPQLVSLTPPRVGCSHGYRLSNDHEGCVLCPAGSYSAEGTCLLCPKGTYQDTEGQDVCERCPRGSSSSPGAFSINHCLTDCQRRGLRCTEIGDLLPAQSDLLSATWRCFNSEGSELDWTMTNTSLTDDDCSVLRKFQSVPKSEVIFKAEDTEVLQRMTLDLRQCAQACAMEPSCHHMALAGGHCVMYSTHPLNTHCNVSDQAKGFLGNSQAELFGRLRCLVRVRGKASDVLIVRKIGAESTSGFLRSSMAKVESGVFRTLVFTDALLADAHRFCELSCHRDDCCHGFILNRNSLKGGSVLCGLLRAPSVLMCRQGDWDVIGQSNANRICGVGLIYNKQRRNFLFDFGGQKFTITESALPASNTDDKDYQASIVDFQAIYLRADQSDAASCAVSGDLTLTLDVSVQNKFTSLSEDDVLVNTQRSLPVLSFLLNKKVFTSQHALLWCLTRCDGEPSCSLAELNDTDSTDFFSCFLFPDSRVCGAYDTPLRRPCRPLLARKPKNTFSKKEDLRGPVKSFYERVSFRKMVSYSVRARVNVNAKTPLPQGFMDCERRCDEDACCRGFGFVADSKDGGSGITCVILLSLGIQTCAEERQTSWSVADCQAGEVSAWPQPFGWYQKPVNRWTSSPALCPAFHLPAVQNNVSTEQWSLLPDSALVLDASSPSYDVIHISRDIAADPLRTRDWCLHACQEAKSCAAVSLAEWESATRCVLYPDTTVCALSSAPGSESPAFTCRLVVREPAPQVYLRRAAAAETSVAIAGHGTLRGITTETALGLGRKRVLQFLGVPYARPPIGSLRFRSAQPPDWNGTRDASKARSGCVQPGRADASEDCLYLNVFRPVAMVTDAILSHVQMSSRAILDGSALAAIGNLLVVTAAYRTAALGFLSTGASDVGGNWGASDQEAALAWVKAHISALGGDQSRVTVGAECDGANIVSLLLMRRTPLFHRMLLMGGSLFSPTLFQTPSAARRLTLRLAAELDCATDDDRRLMACLRAASVHALNAAQTKLLVAGGPLQFWSPTWPRDDNAAAGEPASLRRVDLLLGTSQHDGIIARMQGVKDFAAALPGGKTAFYQMLSRSLGGASGSSLLKEAATWFYSLDHSSTPAGYNLFSRAFDNATRDLLVVCPSLRMASHYAKSGANVFLYHQPDSGSRAEDSLAPDVQLLFGVHLRPTASVRFTAAERRLSLAIISYVANFVRSGNPNPSASWPATSLPRWHPILSSEAPPIFLELSPTLSQKQGLRQRSCSFWNHLAKVLTSNGQLEEQSTFDPELPLDSAHGQSQSDKDAYN
ncbi:thyroglobulin isoform X3 [Syngnathus acus]|uniref:thyroglobulin isoform X3 n=1 Tax=Syngnathus acus TaxID=161584 RepID=UPI0018864960|nr:thyroglobulin isoform X3 [Syngnathus acus]